jgi:exodeoxyribonuclease V alpha subunit
MHEHPEQVRCRNTPEVWRQSLHDASAVGPVQGDLIVRYLATEKRFVGIGQARAAALWKAFGPELYRILGDGEVERVAEVLGDELARALVETWRDDLAERDVAVWLDEHRFNPRLAWKIIRIWGSQGAEKLRANPYIMLTFANWDTVDAAARRVGVAKDDPRRQIGAVEAALYQRLGKQHTVCPEDDLRDHVARLLSAPPAVAANAIAIAVLDGGAIEAEGGCQPAGAAAMERYVEDDVAIRVSDGLAGDLFLADIADRELDAFLTDFEAKEGYKLTTEQREGVRMALRSPVSVLCGGAGVGKTSVLKAIHGASERHGRAILQMALSGRAAQRMREATQREVNTIAMVLQLIRAGELELLPGTLLVIDEASMLDLSSAYKILRAMPDGCRLLLVGDPHQLPPIGFGLFFHVIAESKNVPRVELTRVHRQDEATGIPAVAASIRAGVVPALPRFAGRLPGVTFLPCRPDHLMDGLEEIIGRLGGSNDKRILSPLRRGPTGSLAINAHFHSLFARGRPGLPHYPIAKGEPVIWTVNDRDIGLANGTLGRVLSVDPDDDWSCDVNFDDAPRRIEGEGTIRRMELAYAISVHRSQGSQFPIVVIPIFPSKILDRTLIYTAVTRATTQVVLLGDEEAFDTAVAAERASDRRMVGLRL